MSEGVKEGTQGSCLGHWFDGWAANTTENRKAVACLKKGKNSG